MVDRRSFVHRRFGPAFARAYLKIVLWTLFAWLLGFLVAFAILPSPVPAGVRWLGVGLSCAAILLLTRMYRSGMAAFAENELVDRT